MGLWCLGKSPNGCPVFEELSKEIETCWGIDGVFASWNSIKCVKDKGV